MYGVRGILRASPLASAMFAREADKKETASIATSASFARVAALLFDAGCDAAKTKLEPINCKIEKSSALI